MPRDNEKEPGCEAARTGDDTPTAMIDRTVPMRPAADGETLAMTVGDGEGLPCTFQPGDLVAGRYRVARFIGRGGVGEVYEVEDEELHGRLALKTLRADTAGAEAVGRFKREIQLARRITHPNICRIYDMGYHEFPSAEGGTGRRIAFLTMELLRGESLTDLVRRHGRLRTAEALPIVRQLAAALDAAHEIGIVHRDFKGANVILAEGPAGTRAVVTDFGLARTVQGADESLTFKTCQSSVLGTPAYISPEQLDGSPITPAADLYSLGVVIYEMVTGRLPFTGDTPVATMVKRLVEAPQPPRLHVPELNPLWESVLLRCLEKNPERRFRRAGEVVTALEQGLPPADDTMTLQVAAPRSPAPPPAPAGAPAAPRPDAPPPRRRLLRVVLPLLVILALAAVVARVWLRSVPERVPESGPGVTGPPAPSPAPVPGPAPALPAPPEVPGVSATPPPAPASSPAETFPAPAAGAAIPAATAPSADNLAREAAARATEAQAAFSAGRTAEAAALFRESGALHDRAGNRRLALQMRLKEAESDYRLGNLQSVYTVCKEVLERAREGGFAAEQSAAHLWRGYAQLCRGKLPDADRAFAEALSTCPPDDAGGKAAARLGKATVAVYQNRSAEAASLSQTLVGEFRRLRRPADQALAGAIQAHALILGKQLDEARAAIDAATAAARGQDLHVRLSVMIIDAAVGGAAKPDTVYIDRLDALMKKAAGSGFVGLKLQAHLLKGFVALWMKQPLKARELLKGIEAEALSSSFGIISLQLYVFREKMLRSLAPDGTPAPGQDSATPTRPRPRPFRR